MTSQSSKRGSPRSVARNMAGTLAAVLLLCACFCVPGMAHASTSSTKPVANSGAAELNNLGTALANQQLLDRAAEKFAAAYRLDPKMATAEVNQGTALFYQTQYTEAEKVLLDAATKVPQDPHVWYVLGLLYRSTWKNQKAVECFQRVLAIDPTDADTHYFLASSYTDLHELGPAIAEYKAALARDPLCVSAEFGLARALQLAGNPAAARGHFARFQQLTKDKVSSPLSHTYGDEGPLSKVQEVLPKGPAIAPMVPITFTPLPVTELGAATAISANSTQLGGGACILRPEAGGPMDLIVMGNGPHAVRVYRNPGNGRFAEVPAAEMGLDEGGSGVACAVGDFDDDGLPDLAVAFTDRVVLFRNLGHGTFADVTSKVGIRQLNRPAGLTFVDYDHDGDLDLFITGQPKAEQPRSGQSGKVQAGKGDAGPVATSNVLWRNNGNQTFTNWTAQAGLGGAGVTVSATLSDLNNDDAVDLLVTGAGAAPTFYANRREGPFDVSPLYTHADLPPTVGVYVFDFNKDGWMDVALTHAGAPGVTLWRNVGGKHFERVLLPIKGATRGWGVTAVDIDNDGWIDLAVLIETARGPELRVLRNLGPKGFEDVTARLGLDKIKLENPRSLIAADVDGDGDADLIATQLDGPPVVLRNDGGNRNHSLRIALQGLADNKMAIGTKVEVFSDGNWQKWEVAGAAGLLGQGPDEILAGLGSTDHVDIVRLRWPTGVPQDEISVGTKKSVSFVELDRRGSSCPTLFAWDGQKYRFVDDVIGAAVIGHWVSPTSTNTPDPDEWTKVDGRLLRERNGFFSLRFGEPMEEVNYLDQVRLVAVDHPVGTEVYPNERFLSELPFARQKTIVSAAAHPPAGAWDDHGRDVLDLLRYRDNKYLIDFTNLRYAGFANMHTLTLDLGPWTPQDPLRLFLHGYIEYFSASSMYAAWQAGLKPVPPYVEAQMPDGAWERVLDDMGFPAGLPRTIVVDLTGKLPPGARRIRITTNLQIYWDQVLVDNGPDLPHRLLQTELPLASAQLAFRGYPQQIEGKKPGDALTYDYDHNSQTGPFLRARGNYTRYGDVTPLLQKIDDRFVIFGTGEDMDLEFSAAPLPPLRNGWTRDYFFYANGFVKDMDFYEASPYTVAAMPFHGMSTYPYPATEHPAIGPSQMQYELEWNGRFESQAGAHHYRFHYIPRVMLPLTVPPQPVTQPQPAQPQGTQSKSTSRNSATPAGADADAATGNSGGTNAASVVGSKAGQ
ncbi:MAG: FG-GAP-like repeat-containing protein [Acidobacteriaceae bacterium]